MHKHNAKKMYTDKELKLHLFYTSALEQALHPGHFSNKYTNQCQSLSTVLFKGV
jgi:hypothetical protein